MPGPSVSQNIPVPNDAVGLDDVLEAELQAIQMRREKAGDTSDASRPRNDLVGVALSGGGLRSAMFNLGLLQALQESGFMKYVDYLSTVSGGGYIGGFYSSIGHNFSTESPQSTHKTTDAGNEAKADPRRYIPELYRATHRFINAGQYLNQPWAFFAGYLLPSIAVFLLFFSGLVMVASLVAMFLRMFDLPHVSDHLELLSLNTEVAALCVAIGSLWFVFMLIYWIVRFATRGSHRKTSGSYGVKYGPCLKLLATAVLCGGAIMLGNYDFGLVSGSSIQFQNKELQTPLIVLSGLGLLTLFRLPLLLRSDQQTATMWQKAVLWVILSATVGGSTLAMLSIVGSEGISGYASKRGPRLDYEDVIDNRAFIQWLRNWGNDGVITKIQLDEFERGVKDLDDQRRDLFPDDIIWRDNPATILYLDDVKRGVRYLFRFLEQKHEISDFLDQQESVRKLRNAAVDRVNEELFRGEQTGSSDLPKAISPTPTIKLLTAFSERVMTPAKLENSNGGLTYTRSKYAPTNPVEVRQTVAAYLDSRKNHAKKPLLGKEEFLLALEQMIQPDGQMRYGASQFEPHKELVFRRQLLEMTNPYIFKQKAFISTSVVIANDQFARMWFFLISAVIFGVMCYIVDFNHHAAVFHFYRERIARTFIEAGSRNPSKVDMPLSRFAPWEKGFPYPLISAALKLPQSVDINQHEAQELDRNPAKVDGSVGSEWYSFLLSPKYVGYMMAASGTADSQATPLKTYRPTEAYLHNELSVSDAVTLSGAAFTPWMAGNSALNLLMHAFNLRLEQWLPNPGSPLCLRGKRPMKLWNIVRECVRCSTSDGLKQWERGIVADGGFREFLGVEELIARRCRIIVVSDAGCNNGLSEFGVLADLVRQVRLDHDVRILDLDHDLPLDTARMRRTKEGQGVQHFIVGRIRYPATDKQEPLYQRTGLFVYVQMSLTGDEDVDLAQFQKLHPTFPDEPITNQFFTSDQVESLRQLGHHVGRHLCQRFDPDQINKPVQRDVAVHSEHPHEPGSTEPNEMQQSEKLQSELNERLRRISETRTEQLADALVGAYLVECRQEEIVGKDDTPPDQPVIDGELDDVATEAFREYEERGRGRRLAHFITYVVDGFVSSDDPQILNPSLEILRLSREIEAKDLAGLAVECNRRHVGFRSENPDRYFRIGGRRLLLRSTSRAIALFPGAPTTGNISDDDEKYSASDADLAQLLNAVSRLAASVPEGVFRKHGVETSRDLTLCVLSWLGGRLKQFSPLYDRLNRSLNRFKFRLGLEKAIRTKLAVEIFSFLEAALIKPDSSESEPKKTLLPTKVPSEDSDSV